MATRLLLYGLVAILTLAPLPFASVQRAPAHGLVSACLLLGAVWVFWRAGRGMRPLPWKDPLLAAGALVGLFGLIQIVPLPGSVLKALSPGAADLRAHYEPAHSPGDSGRRPISLDPQASRRSLLMWIAYVVVALVSLDLAARGSARAALAVALVASAAFQAVYGLAEYFSGRQHIFGYAKRYYTDVATGTFINRNHYAGYLEMTLPLVVALLATALGRLRSGRGATLMDRVASAPGKDVLRSGLLLVLALVMATALICSRSRMGIASISMALFTMGIVLARGGRGWSYAAAAVAVGGVTLVLFSQGGAGAPIVDRFLVAASEFQGNLGRREMWSQAIAMAGAFPLFGVGLGAFGTVFPVFRTGGAGVDLSHAHNDFVELAAEAGVAGCLAVAGAAAIIVVPMLTRRAGRTDYGLLGFGAAAGLLAIGFHSLADFNLEIPGNAVTLAAIVGLAIGWRRPTAPVPAAAPAPIESHGWPASAWVAAALLVLLAWAPWAGGDGVEQSFRAAAVAEKGAMDDLRALIEARSSGQDPSPLAAQYIARRLDRARTLQEQGLRQLPISAAGHLGLGRIAFGRCAATALSGGVADGCAGQAVPELRAAVALAPMDAAVHAQVARILVSSWPLLGEAQRGACLAIVERAAAMNPEDRELQAARAAVSGAPRG